MKYLLDTNICIYVINNRPPQVIARFREKALSSVAVSALTVSELAFGAAKSGSQRNLETLEKFLAPVDILPFDEACAWQYGQVRAHLSRIGTPIGSIDQLIAAHALALDAVLVTNNVREFQRVPSLRIENWAEPSS